MPFIKVSTIDLSNTLIICMFQPIWSKDSAASLACAAETAIRSWGENNPSIALNRQGLAGRVNVGQDWPAKLVVDSIGEIHSFAIVERIVELLADGVVFLLVADDANIEAYLIGVVENRRRLADADYTQ